jgi:hypothetical protein
MYGLKKLQDKFSLFLCRFDNKPIKLLPGRTNAKRRHKAESISKGE